ncbi:hypothetical protein CR983_03240 [Candidatus Saccharibacteria bacterium]|nr:MAG: hypothetical protein CR983_03240 [Candidatus Saccharibacteria bacterium]
MPNDKVCITATRLPERSWWERVLNAWSKDSPPVEFVCLEANIDPPAPLHSEKLKRHLCLVDGVVNMTVDLTKRGAVIVTIKKDSWTQARWRVVAAFAAFLGDPEDLEITFSG